MAAIYLFNKGIKYFAFIKFIVLFNIVECQK